MQVKKFVAPDMRQGLKQIRDELGPQAVILSSRRVDTGVEILTGLEADEGASAPEVATSLSGRGSRSPSSFATVLNQQAQVQAPAQAQPARSVDEDLMAAMRSEIENLRLLVKDQMAHLSHEHWNARNPLAAAVMKRFAEYGLSELHAQKIAQQVSQHATIDEAWQAALQQLARQIPLVDPARFDSGVVALLGPTGAGKTTTLAKMAVRYALRHGRDNLALVTMDRYRVAAYEQIKALGRILDIPVKLVDENTQLDKVLRSFRDKSLVLVDTAGFQQGADERAQQLDALNQVEGPVKKLLVMPCTSQEQALRVTFDWVAKCPVDACVLSKTDEIMCFGEVLSLVVEKALPVAYITNGQSIPDHLLPATAQRLIDLMLATQTQVDIPMSELMGTQSKGRIRMYAGS